MATEAVVRKWGNSLGIVLPKEVIEQKHLKPKDRILVEVVKEADLSGIFGTLKTKISGQKLKDMVRKGWD